MRIYNCHAHIFTNRNVPNNIFPFGLLRLLRQRKIARLVRPVGRFIGLFNRRLSSQAVDRYASLLNIGNLESQEAIFDLLRSFYPRDTRFVILAMDMAFMKAGHIEMPYEQQLDELAQLKKEHPDTCFPFVAADPRRENFLDLVKKYVEEHGFQGIKLYPPFGYFPCDKRLDPLYAYAEKNQIPITTHCSRGGGYSRQAVTRDMLQNPCTGEPLKKRRAKAFTDNYTDPRNYIPVLKRFPQLKLCLAHFGGNIEWDKYLATPRHFGEEREDMKNWLSVIKDDLIRPHDNVYADISYILYDHAYMPLLKVLLQDEKVRRRVLYGSDYYVVARDLSERAFSINIRASLDANVYKQIAEINPETFLFGERVAPEHGSLPV